MKVNSHNQEGVVTVMLRVERVAFDGERMPLGLQEEEVVVGKQQKGLSHVNYSIASPFNIHLPNIDI